MAAIRYEIGYTVNSNYQTDMVEGTDEMLARCAELNASRGIRVNDVDQVH